MFAEFPARSDADYQDIWKRALFVFDTNVLLNLYRYKAVARDEVLAVFEKVKGRVWIPHQVALEFYRNRPAIIIGEAKRLDDARKVVQKARDTMRGELDRLHFRGPRALVDTDPLDSALAVAVKLFEEALDEAANKQQKPTGPDPLREKLETLFVASVGDAPESQAALNAVFAEADERFGRKAPPGYMDAEKTDVYVGNGLSYQSKYCDYLVWAQLLAHAKKNGTKDVVFVSDDRKEDWWLSVSGQTIQPRPELIWEANAQGGISDLLLYSLESFLAFANANIGAAVSDTTLDEVRQVAEVRASDAVDGESAIPFRVVSGVGRWFLEKSSYRHIKVTRDSWLIRGVNGAGVQVAIEVVATPADLYALDLSADYMVRAVDSVLTGSYGEYIVVFVMSSTANFGGLVVSATQRLAALPPSISIVFGMLRGSAFERQVGPLRGTKGRKRGGPAMDLDSPPTPPAEGG